MGRSNGFYETKIVSQKNQTSFPVYRPFFRSEAEMFIQSDLQIWPQELSLQKWHIIFNSSTTSQTTRKNMGALLMKYQDIIACIENAVCVCLHSIQLPQAEVTVLVQKAELVSFSIIYWQLFCSKLESPYRCVVQMCPIESNVASSWL